MRFGPRNAYYLRISGQSVLPLYLYLDERHIDWMSEQVLQHVLSDLRPKILPKLKEEANARLRPGGPSNAKRGTVDVHRGETYQFAYFLAETKQHSVLIKTRHFVPAPAPPPGALPPPRPPSLVLSNKKGKKRTRASKKTPAPSQKTKQRKTKGKQRAIESDEDVVIAISSDEGDEDDPAAAEQVKPRPPAAAPRRSARAKKIVADGYREQDEYNEVQEIAQVYDVDTDVDMAPSSGGPPAGTTADSTTSALQLDDSGLIAMDESGDTPTPQPVVKSETVEPSMPLTGEPEPVRDIIAEQTAETAASSQAEAQPSLHEEEEEDKKKLALRLKYEGFNIQGHHLCVVVEPYPPIRGPARAPSLAPIFANATTQRAPSIAPPDFVVSGGAAQREKTPLFLPEYDRERSVTPALSVARQRILPPVPLFNEGQEDSDSDDGGFMQFSQILKSVGQDQPGAMEDDDEMDGAIFFGDADETREL
ncbi:hypothetical protein DAEQUDRAFT_761195 [Daedalea quercina L-15889]|uniref:Uncharacterized protein n=1 Tax=Daedalea quercina L-15889 TaxID=1314783 RepID=A0A165U321_9APHY|nr:hypothetical protein DAEQUDRAFT_761195 [Daedalea quercina L-15889]